MLKQLSGELFPVPPSYQVPGHLGHHGPVVTTNTSDISDVIYRYTRHLQHDGHSRHIDSPTPLSMVQAPAGGTCRGHHYLTPELPHCTESMTEYNYAGLINYAYCMNFYLCRKVPRYASISTLTHFPVCTACGRGDGSVQSNWVLQTEGRVIGASCVLPKIMEQSTHDGVPLSFNQEPTSQALSQTAAPAQIQAMQTQPDAIGQQAQTAASPTLVSLVLR